MKEKENSNFTENYFVFPPKVNIFDNMPNLWPEIFY